MPARLASESHMRRSARTGASSPAKVSLPMRSSISRATSPRAMTGDVVGDVDAAGGTFAFDGVGRGHDGEISHIGEAHMAASRCFDQKLTQRRVVGPHARHAPDGDLVNALPLIHFANFSTADERVTA